MNFRSLCTIAFLVGTLSGFAQQKTDILIVGSDHLAQIYNKEFPNTDVFLPKAQQEVSNFAKSIAAYQPDLVAVEVLPKYQQEIDSLYALYVQDKLDFKTLTDGRSEVYQIAFRVAKQRKLDKIYCVNAPGGTSQSILDNGDNIDIYKNEGLALRKFAVDKLTELRKGAISFGDYLHFGNQPEIAKMVYHLRYITPARITNGKFKNPDAMIDTAFINPKYIGAELTATFKNRDYKIYSNIVTSQMQTKAKRMLLVIGVAHILSLKNILRDDEQFQVVEVKPYLK